MTDLEKYTETELSKESLVQWTGMSIEAERIANAIEITCDEEESMAISAISKIKSFGKETEAARKNHVEPFNKLVKRVNDMFRPISDSIEKAETEIKAKIGGYRTEKEKARLEFERKQQEEFQRKIAEEQAKAKAEKREAVIIAPPVATMKETVTRTENGSAFSRKVWKFRIVDEAQIPRQYLAVDETKIRAAIKSGVHAIQGCEIYETEEIAIR
jgi:hypothetical protein